MKAKFPVITLLLILSALFPLSGRSQDLTTGLLAYYPFNANANDATCNGNDGTIFGGVQLTTDNNGNSNSAYQLNGVDGYISIPGTNLNPSSAISGSAISLNQCLYFVASFDNDVQNLHVDGLLVQTATASIYDRALTFNDVAAFCPALSCPSLTGTLTGSNTCNNAPALLTFHAGTGTGAGPFSITYTDGVNTYTQPNVMDGTPFQVSVKPTTTTTYTLVFIQDNSGCPATAAAPGITATIHPGSCSLCTGTLGDPIINVDFGSGTGNSPPLETAVPGASSVNLIYVPVSGNPAQPVPLDGYYTITNNVPGNPNWYQGGTDHTGNPNGYMLFENANTTPGEFFTEKVSNLCGSGTYEFAAWLANADNLLVVSPILPDLTFIVQTEDGTVLNTYNTGPVPQFGSWTWQQYGFFFTLPPTVNTVVIRIINNAPGGFAQPGNDFAIDDITFRACGPLTTASFSPTTALNNFPVCQGSNAMVYGTLSSGYTSPQYLWQVSADSGKTWTDLPGSNNLQLQVTPPITGKVTDYYYRMLAGDGVNIQSPNCRVVSNVIILTATVLPNVDFSFLQDVCTPLQVDLSASTLTGATYSWNIEGADHTGTDPTSPDLTYMFSSFGSIPVTVKISDGTCAGSITKTVQIGVTPADIIRTADTAICAGQQVFLSANSSFDFCWSPTTYLDHPENTNPTATPAVTTKYYYTAKIMGTNLIVNGDFSQGNTGFTSAYTYDPNNKTEGQYFVGANAQAWNPAVSPCTDHTTGNGKMLLLNGDPTPNVGVWSQKINVQPNTIYAFTTWIESIYPDNPASLQFSINGTPLGNPINASGITCDWQQFYTTWNSGTSTTATISIVNKNTIVQGNDFALDDISFAPFTLERDSVTITVNPLPVVIAKPDTTICSGSTVTLHASGATTYSWTPVNLVSNPNIDAPVATPYLPTDFTVTGTSLGCSSKTVVTVKLFDNSSITITPDTSICTGDAVRLRLVVQGGGTYSWSPASLLDDPSSATPLASTPTDNLFHVSITDANGCPATDSVWVRIRPIPVFVQPTDLDICKGLSGILGKNDPLNYVYSWQPATGLDNPSSPRPKVTPEDPEQYSVTITDSLCSLYTGTFQVNVTVNPSPVVLAQKAHDIDCSQPTTQLNATGAASYTWEPAIGLSDTTIANPLVNIDSTTNYIVKGINTNGCYSYSEVTVNVRSEGKNLFVVPNAFSPNGDGHNDCFGIQRWGDVVVEEFSIYNRWGQRVFTTRNPGGCWDGYFNGHPQPAGNYVYLIRAKSFCGPILRTGSLMLVR